MGGTQTSYGCHGIDEVPAELPFRFRGPGYVQASIHSSKFACDVIDRSLDPFAIGFLGHHDRKAADF